MRKHRTVIAVAIRMVWPQFASAGIIRWSANGYCRLGKPDIAGLKLVWMAAARDRIELDPRPLHQIQDAAAFQGAAMHENILRLVVGRTIGTAECKAALDGMIGDSSTHFDFLPVGLVVAAIIASVDLPDLRADAFMRSTG
jgi:hypothetical protein